MEKCWSLLGRENKTLHLNLVQVQRGYSAVTTSSTTQSCARDLDLPREFHQAETISQGSKGARNKTSPPESPACQMPDCRGHRSIIGRRRSCPWRTPARSCC